MIALTLDPDPKLAPRHPAPKRAPGEALIALRMAGVCDTDLQLARGYMGFRGVPGHEFVGEVLECEDSDWVGQRVVGDINAGCGRCVDCLESDGHHCRERSVLGILKRDGCLAERFSLPVRNLVAVPDAVADEAAVFAEPLAAGLHVLEEVRASGAHHVAVLGDGKLGLLTALALQAEGVQPVLIGHHRSKLAIAGEVGVRGKLENELDQSTSIEPFDLVVEATGNPLGLRRALSLLRPKGTLVLKTTVADPAGLDLSPVVIHELRVIGSRCGDMSQAMGLLASGRLDPRPLISASYPLSEAVAAFGRAGQGGVLKVLVTSG